MHKKEQVLVTGATSGIGYAITTSLAEAGHNVLAVGRRREALTQLEMLDDRVEAIEVDLSDREFLVKTLEGREIDVLVNNAGLLPSVGKFDLMDQDDIDKMIEINLTASIFLTRLVLPNMVKRKKGHIFFTGSTAGQTPFPNVAVYGATKAAISSFASSLRCDISGSGVRITEIVAGRVETSIYNNALSPTELNDMYTAFDAVQPSDIANMLISVLDMPENVDVTRFDILPTAQYVGGGGFTKK